MILLDKNKFSKTLIVLGCCLILTGCLSEMQTHNQRQETIQIKRHETIVADLSSKDWVIVNRQDAGDQAITEAVPTCENINNWSKLITINYTSYSLVGHTTSPRDMFNMLLKAVQKDCPDTHARILKQTANEIVYQWRIVDCGTGMKANQVEVGRIIKGPTGFNAIHYVVKTDYFSPALRHEMLNTVSTASLIGY